MIDRNGFWNAVRRLSAVGALLCATALGGCDGSPAPEPPAPPAPNGGASLVEIAQTRTTAAPASTGPDMLRAPAPRRATPEEVQAHLAQIQASRQALVRRGVDPHVLNPQSINGSTTAQPDTERKAP